MKTSGNQPSTKARVTLDHRSTTARPPLSHCLTKGRLPLVLR